MKNRIFTIFIIFSLLMIIGIPFMRPAFKPGRADALISIPQTRRIEGDPEITAIVDSYLKVAIAVVGANNARQKDF